MASWLFTARDWNTKCIACCFSFTITLRRIQRRIDCSILNLLKHRWKALFLKIGKGLENGFIKRSPHFFASWCKWLQKKQLLPSHQKLLFRPHWSRLLPRLYPTEESRKHVLLRSASDPAKPNFAVEKIVRADLKTHHSVCLKLLKL